MINFKFTDYFAEGDKIYGFCNGFFGRDDYNDKEVVTVSDEYVLFKYVEKTLLQNEDGYYEIQEYTILQLNQVLSFNSNTGFTNLKYLEELKRWFSDWMSKEQGY